MPVWGIEILVLEMPMWCERLCDLYKLSLEIVLVQPCTLQSPQKVLQKNQQFRKCSWWSVQAPPPHGVCKHHLLMECASTTSSWSVQAPPPHGVCKHHLLMECASTTSSWSVQAPPPHGVCKHHLLMYHTLF